MSITYTLNTSFDRESGNIRQELAVTGIQGKAETLSTWLIRTQDASLRNALIALGWIPPVTDTEALVILAERESLGNYIAMADDERGIEKPYFRKGSIILRGDFFPDELEAILHFAPKQVR